MPISSLPSQTAAGTVSTDSAVIHQTPRGHSHGRPICICLLGLVLRCRVARARAGTQTLPSQNRDSCGSWHRPLSSLSWRIWLLAMAEAELCVSTSRPLPKPKPAGSRWTLHAGERQVQEDRAPRVDSHSPRFNPQTYPLSFPSNASLLFVDPFVTAYIPRYYRRLPAYFSLSSGLGQCVLTAVSIDSAIVLNLGASIVQELIIVCSVLYIHFCQKPTQIALDHVLCTRGSRSPWLSSVQAQHAGRRRRHEQRNFPP